MKYTYAVVVLMNERFLAQNIPYCHAWRNYYIVRRSSFLETDGFTVHTLSSPSQRIQEFKCMQAHKILIPRSLATREKNGGAVLKSRKKTALFVP